MKVSVHTYPSRLYIFSDIYKYEQICTNEVLLHLLLLFLSLLCHVGIILYLNVYRNCIYVSMHIENFNFCAVFHCVPGP